MKYTMMIAALCFAASACVSPDAHQRLQQANEQLKAQIAKLSQAQVDLAARAEQLERENSELGARAADAAWIASQKEKIAELMKRYGEGGTSQVPGVEIVQTKEGMAFRVAGGVLFESGQNALSEGGKRTLREILPSLQAQKLRVEGHTDDVPIARSSWGTNLRLSVERAMTVADFLILSGVPTGSVSAAGYGPNRPAVEGTTDEARQKNRRVEILILEE